MNARIPKGGAVPQNSQQMVKQAQKMQDDIIAIQSEIEERYFSTTAGGGAVEIVMSGKKEIRSLNIKKEIIEEAIEDPELLTDLIISAVNEIGRQIDETTEIEMEKVTGGVSLPGLF